MNDLTEVNHHIQKYILSILSRQKIVRFRGLRPARVDTNLFSYHLKLLQKNKLIDKVETGYTLAPRGLRYVDHVVADRASVVCRPKIVTMLLIQDGYGNVLLQKRTKQPYIDMWTLPHGVFHIDDESVIAGAKREAQEKLGLNTVLPRHVGDAYIRVTTQDELLSSTLVHVCRFELDEYEESADIKWCAPLKLSGYNLAPAVEQIVTRSFFGDHFFFDEYVVEYN